LIIADVHEPEKYRKIASKTENLEVVDFLVVGEFGKFAVERKTVDDLINSRNDGRLWKQLEALAKFHEEGYISVLAVIGNWGKLFRMKRMTLNEFFGLHTAIAKYGVFLFNFYNEKFFLSYMRYLNDRVGRPSKRTALNVPKPKERTIKEERRDMLAMINGVGIKTAEELLEEFKTIRGVVNADREKLERILKSKTDHFLEVIG
jgi:ERCC4-type nuclease